MEQKIENWIYHPEGDWETRLVPVFRRKFEVRDGLKTARLSCAAHGIYEAELNGLFVTADKFTPASPATITASRCRSTM